MKMERKSFLVGVMTVMLAAPFGVWAQAETLAVSAIKPTPALLAAMEKSGKKTSLERVIQSLDSQLMDRIHATRKFQVVGRSDLKEGLEEQALAVSGNVDANDKNAAKAGKMAGAKYILVTTLDDFQDYNETAKFEGMGTSATKRIIRMSAVGKIYNSTTMKLIESTNFQISNKEISQDRNYSTKDGNLSDELMEVLSRNMAEKIANRMADVIFPAKVVVKRDKTITINRGEGSGIAVGQTWNVYALGAEMTDPDTKESLGKEEVLVGKARVTQVTPKTSQAELLEDAGVDQGHVLRLPQ